MRAFYCFLLCKPYLPPEIRYMICQAYIRSMIIDEMGYLTFHQQNWLDMFFRKKSIVETKRGYGKSEFIARLSRALIMVKTYTKIVIVCNTFHDCRKMWHKLANIKGFSILNHEFIQYTNGFIRLIPSTGMIGEFDLYLYDGVIPKQHHRNEFIIV